MWFKTVLAAIFVISTLMLGVMEGAVALPLISVGLLLMLVCQTRWWWRLTCLVLASLVWGVGSGVSPGLLLVVLLGGSWLVQYRPGRLSGRVALLAATGLSGLLISSMQAASPTPSVLGDAVIQLGVLWLISSRFTLQPSVRPPLFTVPPTTIPHAAP